MDNRDLSVRGVSPELLQRLKQEAIEQRSIQEKEKEEQSRYNEFVDPGSAFAAGFMDIPGQVGFENISYGAGIKSNLIRNKRRYRDGSKNVIDRSVKGVRPGFEEFVKEVPGGPPNEKLFLDQVLGEYVNPEGKTVYVDKELRNAMRDKFREKSSYYKAGVNSMLAIDVVGVPALLGAVVKNTPRAIKYVGEKVPQAILNKFPKITASAIGLAVSSSSTEAEAKAKIANIVAGIKAGSKTADYSTSTQQALKQVNRYTKGAEVIAMPEEFFTFIGSKEKYINAKPELRATQRKIYNKHLELEKKYGDLPIWQKMMEDYKANPLSVDGRSYNANVLQKIKHIDKYLDTAKNKFSKSKPGLKNVSMEEYVFPKNAEGNLLTLPQQTKFRQLVDDYQQYLSNRRRYESSYNKSKSKAGGRNYDTIVRSEANQQINWMLDNAKKNPGSIFEVVEVKGITGKPTRVGVLDKDSGVTYYRDGFLEGDKLVKQLKNLDPALHKSIINHPDFLETKKLFDARRTFSHALPSDNLAKQFDNYEFPGRPEEFRLMDKLSEYVTILERGADPTTYPSFGKASMLDIHHTKGVGIEATDPRYLQLVERNANQRETVSAAFYNALKMGDTTEAAVKIAAKEVKRFPGLRLDLRLPDGSFVRVGQKLNPEAAIKKHKQRMEKIINKYIKQDENFIDDFADFVGLKSKKNMSNITESEMAMGMMGMGNAEGGPPINRKDFVTPGLVGDDEEKRISDRFTGLSFGFGNIREIQQDIKDLYDNKLSDTIEPIREATEIKVEDVLKDTRTVLNNGESPIEVRPVTEGYKLFTESPIVRSIVAAPATAKIKALETVESIYNSLRKGTENDIQMEEYFPAVYGLQQFLTQSVGKTPDDQTYISFIDEVNRAQETGFTRLGYNIVDLASLAPDWAFGTDATGRIKKSYDKMIEEGRITEPETFLGEVGAIGVEFGVPGGAVFKGVNTLRRMIKATTGVNLFAVPTYSMGALVAPVTGSAILGAKISNVAKRVGTTAAVFGGTDFIAGGPYNTVSEVFKDDPLLFDNSLGYDYENTEGLSGKELSVANFKNRLRFGADGAIIGGLFPLVGPPLWALTKYGVLKPSAFVGGKTLQLGNELAVKPLTYLAGGTLKAPFTKPGKLEVEVPGLREVSQGLAGGTKIFANFLGKDVITRAAVAAMGAKPGLIKQLPDFKDWRMFEVNDSDPLKANLKKIDKVFEFFREAGAKSPDQLYLDVKTQNFIKSKSRQIEKMLDSVERKSYDLANGFLKRYNTSKTSPAGEDYLLDQVLSYIKGQIKLSDLPQELQSMSKALSEEFDSVRNFYKDVLPDNSGLKQFLTSNLKSYIRQSFGVFTNPQFKVDPKLKEKAIDFVVDRIRNNESLVELSVKGSVENTDNAIRNFARQQVEDLLATVKTEGFDPIIQLQKIAKENLKLDDVYVQTGEELPDVIRKLLGEENSLRSSVMQTTSSLVTQAANLKNYNRIGELLLQQGRLFASRDEAIRAGVVNPVSVGRVPGLGLLDSGITQLYGSKEVTGVLRGSLGQLDKFMESSIYQSMIAYKAGVQTGKTVLSPATQTRNFGSAAAFVLNNGWIGGKASVSDAIKITLDDIFGAGRTFNEEELIKNITRKSELGVIDENIVASELSAVLADIKSGKVGTFGKIASAADNSKLMKTATRLYSGGDNVWKWYGHEYLKSQLKGAFKSIDEVKKTVKDDFGITEFNPKNMYEAVEEYSAMLVRELMPTYSKVPPMIQAIRKIPFIGNFVSFPAEIIRTSFATSLLAMKHIASNNPTLRAMGYRSLMGQAATLWALNEGARGLGYAMTNITPEQIRTYKDEFAPDYMKFSDLIPISNMDEKRGTFKVFDMSRYNPYDLISSTANNLIVRATDPKAKLDPDKVETDVLSEYINAAGPLLDLLNGTLFGLSIGTEGVYEAVTGRTKTGSAVWSTSDGTEIFDKIVMHILNKNEPGIISSAQRIYSALSGDVTGTGQPLRARDEMFKVIGGSTVTVDVPGSFAYKITNFNNSLRDPKTSESYFSTKNYQNRGPAQLVREYNDMNQEAFREQYKFYRAVKSALDSGLMTEDQIKKALRNRTIPKKTIRKILRGQFTAVPLSLGGYESRYEKIRDANPDKRFDKYDFVPKGELKDAQRNWNSMYFEDFEIQRKEPEQVSQAPIVPTQTQTAQPNLPVPPLPDTGTPEIAPNQMANVSGTAVSPQTGLTNSESVYLSPTEQLYRRKERGLA